MELFQNKNFWFSFVWLLTFHTFARDANFETMTTDNRITDIIAQLGELRELLLVIEQSGEATPPILLKLAREKAEGIFNSTDQLCQPDFWEALNRQYLAEWEELQPVEESIAEEPRPEEPEMAVEEEVVVEEEPVENVFAEVVEDESAEEDEELEEDGDLEEEDALFDDEEDEYYEDDLEEEEVREESGIPESLTLDEALQRKRTQELRKALSLNDKFRFRRELFGNSDVRMNETLALIDAMSSYEEAEDYLYNDLGWDVENPEVAEFMKIVQNRFL